MNNGARRPPAVTGSITNDNSGMPTMENPPPNAPFMKQIRNTPAKETRPVATVSSIALLRDRSGPGARLHVGRARVGIGLEKPECPGLFTGSRKSLLSAQLAATAPLFGECQQNQ